MKVELYRVRTGHGKSWILIIQKSRPGKSWKMTVVMESHEKVMGINVMGHGIFILDKIIAILSVNI